MKVTHFFFFIYNAIPFLILSILLNKVPLVESSGGAVGGNGHEKFAIEEKFPDKQIQVVFCWALENEMLGIV